MPDFCTFPSKLNLVSKKIQAVHENVRTQLKNLIPVHELLNTEGFNADVSQVAGGSTYSPICEALNGKFDKHYQVALRGKKTAATAAEDLLQATENYNIATNEESAAAAAIALEARAKFEADRNEGENREREAATRLIRNINGVWTPVVTQGPTDEELLKEEDEQEDPFGRRNLGLDEE